MANSPQNSDANEEIDDVKKASAEGFGSNEQVFPPSAAFVAKARVKGMDGYHALYQRSIQDPDGFWADEAKELTWFQPWTKVVDESKKPFFRWFVDGKTNVAYNCLDAQVAKGLGDKVAIVYEGEPTADGKAAEVRRITYRQLLSEVSRFSNVLKGMGLKRGDTVAIYMPMVPELAMAVLACARLGIVHSVVFGGFSAESIRDRVNDAKSKAVITMDGGYRRGKFLPLKQTVDEGVKDCPSCAHVLVLQRHPGKPDAGCVMQAGRDVWYHEAAAAVTDQCEAVQQEANEMLFLLYTSGSTGKPKGIMHTTGGYLTHVTYTHKYVFDLHPESDVYWCTADVGWITGHSYIVYGPLSNGATQVIYEGVPNYPANDRLWSIVEKYGVTIFYTAPTAIRTFMKWGDDEPAKHDMSTLRLLGSVGEPINPEAWMWYRDTIGRGECPVVDTWWQTETGGIMISPLPGATTLKPGSATFPVPGISAEVVDDAGHRVDQGGGYLTLTRPWPGMLRGIWNDPERYQETYWSRFEGRYFAGDGAKLDSEGYLWLLGRVDDVMNISGHRISTTEVESALVSHPAVAEAAVVGANDPTTGQAIIAYVTLRGGYEADETELRNHVAKEIGAIAKPKMIYFTPELPKTRSGKIMRRLLRDVAEGRNLGDTTTLADASVVNELQKRAAEAPSED